MIVVDSSVWIGYFNGVRSFETDLLDNLLGEQDLAVGDLILVEVLQGFRSDKDFKEAKKLFESFHILNMGGYEVALESANNYRYLRKKGCTIRKTIDVVIATFCIKNNLKLLHSDRDFDVMAKHLGLVPLTYN